jgi:hypothetical protein
MSQAAWETDYSVETDAPLSFAWEFMSNVANWDDPPARFSLDGRFVTGARGTTQMPDQPAQPWQLSDVTPMQSYTVSFDLNRATLSFKWTFDPVVDRTRLTQHVRLSGENAGEYLTMVQQTFSANLAPGMERIAASIHRAFAAAPGS